MQYQCSAHRNLDLPVIRPPARDPVATVRPVTDLRVRDLVPADHDAALDVRLRSFGPLPSDGLAWWDPVFEQTVAARRALGVFDGDLLVASARIFGYRQLWGGRALPMAGIAGVVVAPEWRGRGVATMLMTAVLERSVELGDVVSVLFPAALPPYRRLGWELAGAMSRTSFGPDGLRRLGGPSVAVRRAGPPDADAVARLLRHDAERSRASGPLELTYDDVHGLLSDSENFCYLADDGALVYAWDGKDLRVERVAAETPETLRALWAVVGSGASAVRQVYTYQPAQDPVHWLLPDKAGIEVEEDRWMLRILDAGAAVAGRGFPAGVTADVPLVLDDRWLVGCAGSFRLTVSGGRGELVPDHERPAEAALLGPNGFAALYAGTPVATLRRAGLLSGADTEIDAVLDAVFASRCYLLDRF